MDGEGGRLGASGRRAPSRGRRWRVAAPLPFLLLATCGPVAMLTRPDGDGGWTTERRTRELERRASAAAVDLAPRRTTASAPADPTAERHAPLTLAAALQRAGGGNRRLAEARQQLAIARARVAEVRGRLFPATTATGRYAFATGTQTTRAPSRRTCSRARLPPSPSAIRTSVP